MTNRILLRHLTVNDRSIRSLPDKKSNNVTRPETMNRTEAQWSLGTSSPHSMPPSTGRNQTIACVAVVGVHLTLLDLLITTDHDIRKHLLLSM